MARRPWPAWWNWELELCPHVLKRMVDRRFSEIELRTMFDVATGLRRDVDPDRWIIETRCGRRRWEVVVEPDHAARVVVVVTAFEVD